MIQDIISYYINNWSYVLDQIGRHFLISIYGVLFAAIIGIPLGFYIAKRENLANLVNMITNVLQTIPSLALLAILMFALGIGANTVVAAVFVYSLLPIIKNTVTGIRSIDFNVLDSAKAMGMSRMQRALRVELPLALPMIMGGIRNALVVGIGVTAVGTFIGAGGLGDIITRGVTVANGEAIIFAGAIPTALMAILVDVVLQKVEESLQNRI